MLWGVGPEFNYGKGEQINPIVNDLCSWFLELKRKRKSKICFLNPSRRDKVLSFIGVRRAKGLFSELMLLCPVVLSCQITNTHHIWNDDKRRLCVVGPTHGEPGSCRCRWTPGLPLVPQLVLSSPVWAGFPPRQTNSLKDECNIDARLRYYGERWDDISPPYLMFMNCFSQTWGKLNIREVESAG